MIALIGRQNVGKSTIFNRLTRTSDAIVADYPGLTRDRKYGCAKIKGREFICIDTGGIDNIKEKVEAYVLEQSLLAIEEADAVLFIVDAHDGSMPMDLVIAKQLRSRKKLTFLIVNKIDGININQIMADFCPLGLGKIYPIAAFYNRGINNLLETLLLPLVDEITLSSKVNEYIKCQSQFPKKIETSKEKYKDYSNLQNLTIKLAIVGRPNAGKSTLVNCILTKNQVVVCSIPGTTRDSVYIPMQHDNHKYMIIDTAGVRKRGKITNIAEKFSVIKSLQAIEDANVVLLIIDAKIGVSDQDVSLLGFILSSGRSLVIAVNKWDILDEIVKKQVKKTITYRLGFINFARIHFISALDGKGVGNLFKSVYEAYHNSTHRITTVLVTRVMNAAVKNHQPPLVHGRRVQLKYAHVGGYNPPIIVIHGNQVKNLPDSYNRYLINYFHKSLNIIGTPIRLKFKENDNPYVRAM